MRKSCEAWRKAEATGRRFNCGRSRLMISGAPILRWDRGLRALHSAAQGSGVLLRKEALGDFIDEDDIENDGHEKDQESKTGIVQNPVKAFAIPGEGPFK